MEPLETPAPPKPPSLPEIALKPADPFAAFRDRIIGGLVFMLPIVITIWIIYWIYSTFQSVFLNPAAELVRKVAGHYTQGPLPPWWNTYASPLLAIILAVVFLYFLGYFVRTKLSMAFDWVLLRLPVVTIIYKAVRNVFQGLARPGGGPTFKRVVLVEFPHPGTKALALVTRSLTDSDTGRAILCVWVVTGMMPPAGFTLFVPEAEVIDVDWTVQEALQIILSGGITAPAAIRYRSAGPTRLIVPRATDAPPESSP